MASIFISTSSSDADFARRLAEALRADGHDAWFYGDAGQPGTWDRAVEEALTSATVTLVALSPDTGGSDNVRDEIVRARDLGQQIVPIVCRPVEHADIPLPIERHIRLDFTVDFNDGLAQLRSMLRRADRYRESREERSRRDPETQERRIAHELESSKRLLNTRRFAGQPPYDPTGIFRDRTEIVARIVRTLTEGRYRLLTVIGRGGIGKTAVACRALTELSVSTADVTGILYMSTRTRGISVDLMADEFCSILPPEQAGELRRSWSRPGVPFREKILDLLKFLQMGHYVVLLDNFEDLVDSSGQLVDGDLAELLTVSLETSSHVRYLVTSRVPVELAEPYAIRIEITDGLPASEAVSVLRELDAEGFLAGEDDDKLRETVERLHGVPHALELVIGRLAQDPFATLDDVVGPHENKMTLVHDLVAHMYRDLDHDARRVMQALAVFARPVPLVAAEYVLKELEPGLNSPAVLRWLASAHFITVNRKGKTVVLHPLDRDFIYDDIPARGDVSRETLHRRCAAFYASQQVPIDTASGGPLLNADPYLLEFGHLVAAGLFDAAALKLREFAIWLTWHGSPGRVEQLLEPVRDKLENPRASLAYHLCQTANATVLGERSRGLSHGEEALRLATRLGDRSEEAYASRRLALVHRYSGDTKKAIRLFQRALDLNEEIGLLRHQAMLHFEISITYGYAGNWRDCIAYARKALEGALEAEDLTVTAYAHNGLALGHYLGGDPAAALAEAEAMLQLRDHAPGEISGYTLQVMALVRAHSGEPRDLELAHAHLEEAATIARRQGHQRLEAYCAHNLAAFAYLRGDAAAAAESAARATELFAPLGLEQASTALRRAGEALRQGDARREAEALLECATHSGASPDFYPGRLLAERAAAIATARGWQDLTAQAGRLVAPPPARGRGF